MKPVVVETCRTGSQGHSLIFTSLLCLFFSVFICSHSSTKCCLDSCDEPAVSTIKHVSRTKRRREGGSQRDRVDIQQNADASDLEAWQKCVGPNDVNERPTALCRVFVQILAQRCVRFLLGGHHTHADIKPPPLLHHPIKLTQFVSAPLRRSKVPRSGSWRLWKRSGRVHSLPGNEWWPWRGGSVAGPCSFLCCLSARAAVHWGLMDWQSVKGNITPSLNTTTSRPPPNPSSSLRLLCLPPRGQWRFLLCDGPPSQMWE